ncbi:MAG: AMP-binding protein [Candidatus Sericytochromatia bacterium]|nr:AMP-binding protein [Candidatus Sericytochromatia bacterium]
MDAFDPVESWEREARERWIDTRLGALLTRARQAPLYRARLADCPAGTPLGLPTLAHLAPLDKATWVAASPPRSHEALTGPLTDALVFRSGGSTGDPKFSIYSHAEFAAAMPLFSRTYRAAGLAPEDRVANLFAAGSLYASFKFVDRLLETMGCLNFPYTASADAEVVADGVTRFGLNVLVGFPSRLLQVMPAIAARGARIEKIFYAGEHLHPEDRQRLVRELGVRVIASAGYGAVDSGLMGHACPASPPGHHHVLSDHVWLEIVDPDHGGPVGPGEPGELLVTNLDRHLQPVIRYRVGDRARWVGADCPCGRKTPVFDLLGRADDALRLGYATLTRAEALAALATVAPVGQAVQLVKQRQAGREVLCLRVEVLEPEADPGLAERLAEALLRSKPDLARLIGTGSLAPVRVELYPQNGIPRVSVTGKFQGVRDETLAQDE